MQLQNKLLQPFFAYSGTDAFKASTFYFSATIFLAQLNELSTPEVSGSATVEEPAVQDSAFSLQRRFAWWNWNQNIQDFPWRSSGALDTSELAFLFDKRGFVLEACSGDSITLRDLSFWLRRIFVYIGKLPDHQVFPGYRHVYRLGNQKADRFHKEQSSVPIAFFRTDELQGLALMMDAGCSKLLSSWEIPLHSPG